METKTQHRSLNPSLAWALGVLELPAFLALAVWLSAWPPFFGIYYPTLNPSAETRDAQSIVNWLAGGEEIAALNPKLVRGQLKTKELNHYADVRALFRKLPWVFWISSVFLAILIGWFRPSRSVMAAAQWRGVGALVILAAFAGGLALWDWKVFFAWVHYPFFGETSWKFSRSAYSLQLFPASFWKAMGAAVCLWPLLLFSLAGCGAKFLGAARRQLPGSCGRKSAA